MTTTALIAVTVGGIEQARRLRARLGSGELYRPERLGPAAAAWDRPYAGALSEHVADLFTRFDELVFFLATGAAIRLIAHCLMSKASDPAVLAVDEAGRFVIPLVGGHAGGANALARVVAGCLGATPVITTASDVVGGLSLDLLDAELDAIIEPRELLKPTAARLVNGENVTIVQSVGRRGDWLDQRDLPANVTIAIESPTPRIWITDRVYDREGVLWYRPRSLVVGLGCERGITADAIEEGFAGFLDRHRFARSSVARIATAQIKEDETGLREWAERNGWEIDFYAAGELAAVEGTPNPSAVVERCVGTPGVAEPAALLASGSDRLLVEKEIVTSPQSPRRMTFALARDVRFEERTTGGIVHFVGAGPGAAELLTVRGKLLLERADTIVYAGSLVPEAILRLANRTAVLHDSASLTHEETMAILRSAVRAGHRTVRLHSGDTSVYSAIQEQIAVLEADEIPYDIVPGVSSFAAAAAALKSELTLPEVTQTIILTRGEGRTPMPPREKLADLARHGATMCIFLSGRLGPRVEADLLTAYPPETPTAVCYRVSWPDETLVVTRLDRLAETLREHGFTRTTLILVGPAIGGRQNRSKLYDPSHAHLFRRRRRETSEDEQEADDPAS